MRRLMHSTPHFRMHLCRNTNNAGGVCVRFSALKPLLGWGKFTEGQYIIATPGGSFGLPPLLVDALPPPLYRSSQLLARAAPVSRSPVQSDMHHVFAVSAPHPRPRPLMQTSDNQCYVLYTLAYPAALQPRGFAGSPVPAKSPCSPLLVDRFRVLATQNLAFARLPLRRRQHGGCAGFDAAGVLHALANGILLGVGAL